MYLDQVEGGGGGEGEGERGKGKGDRGQIQYGGQSLKSVPPLSKYRYSLYTKDKKKIR